VQPEIETLEPRPCVGVTTQIQLREIGDRIGELMPVVMAAAGGAVAGPPYARWLAWDAEGGTGTMELGVPTAGPVSPEGDAAAGELPGGRAVVCWHVGPYDGLANTWKQLGEWVAEKGLVTRGAPWEEYCSDCVETPAAELRTRIVWPVE